MNPTLFLFGYRRIEADADSRTAVMDICLRNEITYVSFRYEKDGAISFITSYRSAKRLLQVAQAEGVRIRILQGGGLPHLIWKHRHRAGLAVGVLLATVLIFLSGRVVWDIRVMGNETMTESEVRAELAECGLFVGSYIPHVHASELENRVLMTSDRISWISIYLDGTVAKVQVIEHTEAPPKEDLSRPANLIASCDGQIELIQLYRGNCVVKQGQAVKAGELLVSGVYDSNTVGYRFTRASGKVLARTERTLTVEIPLIETEKCYLEPKCEEIILNFFDFSLNIYKFNKNTDSTCDIIKEDKDLNLFGQGRLPVCISLSYALPYETVQRTRTPEEALALAYAELEYKLAALSSDTQLLSKTIRTELGETSLILECTLSCVEDIAVQSEFEISVTP